MECPFLEMQAQGSTCWTWELHAQGSTCWTGSRAVHVNDLFHLAGARAQTDPASSSPTTYVARGEQHILPNRKKQITNQFCSSCSLPQASSRTFLLEQMLLGYAPPPYPPPPFGTLATCPDDQYDPITALVFTRTWVDTPSCHCGNCRKRHRQLEKI